MKYYESITTKDGRKCILRNGTAEDGQALLDLFLETHAQTDFLKTYPDECTKTAEGESEYLKSTEANPGAVEILAEVDGVIVGSAGMEGYGERYKAKHRADFGIAIDQKYWGLGIGKALALACIKCAKQAGYEQIELQAVADNEKALELYRKVGYLEYGRNPKGFKSRISGYQEIVMMRLELV